SQSSSPTPSYITQIPTPPSSPSHSEEQPRVPIHIVRFTQLPIGRSSPSRSSEKVLEEEQTRVPIHIVTKAFELPANFLEPSPQAKLVIGFDCEAVDLCRYGTLSIIHLGFPDAIYLVDAIEGGKALIEACKPALESEFVTKVTYDCKRDSETLYFQYGIKLNNVVDTKVSYHVTRQPFHCQILEINLI
ncbi:3'-5' exonuclease, partial [Trifolium medium]|nr:3'-5' exonuclease [Trifolium medium]